MMYWFDLFRRMGGWVRTVPRIQSDVSKFHLLRLVLRTATACV
jgi:hypothetical protein